MDEENQKQPSAQNELPRIRTFETDIEIRKKSGISPSDMVAKSRILSEEKFNKINIKKISLIAVLVLAFGGAALGLFKYFSREEQAMETPTTEQIGKPYIKAELEKKIIFSTVDQGSLISAIKKELETPRKSESFLFLEIPQTIKEFSEFTKIKIPESLLQTSRPSFNVLATYHGGSGSAVFLIKVENFEKAYSAMLSWEQNMWQSFSQFLNAEDINNISRFSFVDEIIKNHDARVLQSQEGIAIIAYAIFNKQFVVIATSREGLSMMLERLIASPPK